MLPPGLLTKWLLFFYEINFLCAANRTDPVTGKVLKPGSRRHSMIGIADSRIINISAGRAVIFIPDRLLRLLLQLFRVDIGGRIFGGLSLLYLPVIGVGEGFCQRIYHIPVNYRSYEK